MDMHDKRFILHLLKGQLEEIGGRFAHDAGSYARCIFKS